VRIGPKTDEERLEEQNRLADIRRLQDEVDAANRAGETAAVEAILKQLASMTQFVDVPHQQSNFVETDPVASVERQRRVLKPELDLITSREQYEQLKRTNISQ